MENPDLYKMLTGQQAVPDDVANPLLRTLCADLKRDAAPKVTVQSTAAFEGRFGSENEFLTARAFRTRRRIVDAAAAAAGAVARVARGVAEEDGLLLRALAAGDLALPPLGLAAVLDGAASTRPGAARGSRATRPPRAAARRRRRRARLAPLHVRSARGRRSAITIIFSRWSWAWCSACCCDAPRFSRAAAPPPSAAAPRAPRTRISSPIRSLSATRLMPYGEPDIRARHARSFDRLAASSAARVRSSASMSWARTASRSANLRSRTTCERARASAALLAVDSPPCSGSTAGRRGERATWAKSQQQQSDGKPHRSSFVLRFEKLRCGPRATRQLRRTRTRGLRTCPARSTRSSRSGRARRRGGGGGRARTPAASSRSSGRRAPPRTLTSGCARRRSRPAARLVRAAAAPAPGGRSTATPPSTPRLDRRRHHEGGSHRHHHSGHSHRSDGGGSGGPLGTPGSTARSSRGGHSARRLDPEGQAAWAELVARAQARGGPGVGRASKRMLSERAAAGRRGWSSGSRRRSRSARLRQLWKHVGAARRDPRTLHVRLGEWELERHALYQELARLRDGGGGGGGGDGGGGATDAAAGGPAPLWGQRSPSSRRRPPARRRRCRAWRRGGASAMQAHRDAARAAAPARSPVALAAVAAAGARGAATPSRRGSDESSRASTVDAILPGGATENAQILASLAAASDLSVLRRPS